MLIAPKVPEIPFSDKKFDVEMTGLELAFIQYLVSNCASGTSQDLGSIVGSFYGPLKTLTNIEHDSFGQTMPAIPVHKIGLSEFKQKINDLNK